jgi:hypothetical protein
MVKPEKSSSASRRVRKFAIAGLVCISSLLTASTTRRVHPQINVPDEIIKPPKKYLPGVAYLSRDELNRDYF